MRRARGVGGQRGVDVIHQAWRALLGVVTAREGGGIGQLSDRVWVG